MSGRRKLDLLLAIMLVIATPGAFYVAAIMLGLINLEPPTDGR